jgi:hypothetical protein
MKTSGDPKIYVIRVGPITCHGPSAASVRRQELAMKRELDELVRKYMAVGLRNPVVHTIVEV